MISVFLPHRCPHQRNRPRRSLPAGCHFLHWTGIAFSSLISLATADGGSGATDTPPLVSAPFHLVRFDEDYHFLGDRPRLGYWENIKFIPLGQSPGVTPFISLGGEIRFQYVEKWNDQFGRIPGEEGSLQQRYLMHMDLVWPRHLRIFGQLISAWEHGRKPASLPTDADHFDSQQLFAEASFDAEAPRNGYVRVGRQEILLAGHQLLKVREGPNVRIAFDGVRFHLTHHDFDTDLFTANVVQPRPGEFDDSWTDDSLDFSGVNIGWHPSVAGVLNFRTDIFIFDYRNRSVRYEQATGAEHRQTYGLRASGRHGPWEFDYEGSLQAGTVGAFKINAWGVALFTTRRWDETPARPKLTLGFSSVTGDRNRNDREINTFNCLFARGDYFGDTSLLTGSNTRDLSLLIECSPTTHLRVALQWDRLWRSETTDGLYAPPLIYIRSGLANGSRDIGNQYTLTTTLNVNRFVTLQAIGAVFVAGDFIKAGQPNKGTEGLTFRTQFKF
jgi:hypothetical protein